MTKLSLGKCNISLGAIPTSYLESLDYAEMIIWMCNYLDTVIVPAINELQQDYTDLSEYVDEQVAGCLTNAKNYTDSKVLELKNYVDGLIGDINSALDTINGEVI